MLAYKHEGFALSVAPQHFCVSGTPNINVVAAGVLLWLNTSVFSQVILIRCAGLRATGARRMATKTHFDARMLAIRPKNIVRT